MTCTSRAAAARLKDHDRESRARAESARHDTLHCFHVDLRAPAIRINVGELAEAHRFARGALPAERSRYVGPIPGRVGAA